MKNFKANSTYKTLWNARKGSTGYNTNITLTSPLDGYGRLTTCSGRFMPGKETPYPLYGRVCGPLGRSEQVRKISSPMFEPRTFQPVMSRSIDYLILAVHKLKQAHSEKMEYIFLVKWPTWCTNVFLCIYFHLQLSTFWCFFDRAS